MNTEFQERLKRNCDFVLQKAYPKADRSKLLDYTIERHAVYVRTDEDCYNFVPGSYYHTTHNSRSTYCIELCPTVLNEEGTTAIFISGYQMIAILFVTLAAHVKTALKLDDDIWKIEEHLVHTALKYRRLDYDFLMLSKDVRYNVETECIHVVYETIFEKDKIEWFTQALNSFDTEEMVNAVEAETMEISFYSPLLEPYAKEHDYIFDETDCRYYKLLKFDEGAKECNALEEFINACDYNCTPTVRYGSEVFVTGIEDMLIEAFQDEEIEASLPC